jgi:hypothetical protein
MTTQIFKIRRDILIPFGVCAGLLLCLFFLALLGRGSVMEQALLAGIALATVALFLTARDRSITFTDRGIVVRKFFRTKEILRDDISHVGCLILRKRVYLLLTTTKGFIILSNAYQDFSALVGRIVAQVGPEKVEEEARAQAEKPLKNSSDVMSLWFAAVVISGLLILKITSN